MNDIGIEWLGDRALLLRVGTGIDGALNACVHAVARALHAAQLPGVIDIVPAYASVAVHYDPRAWNDLESDRPPGEQLARRVLKTALSSVDLVAPTQERENVL
ncbi:carboxyltransferase domain-containing protein, partial [Rudaea sp.]|uniref:carboxyltransferase domain-containing protein n=1 Tax=Rudaea sp. TaxID=2136325 RepID=UPI002ED26FC9